MPTYSTTTTAGHDGLETAGVWVDGLSSTTLLGGGDSATSWGGLYFTGVPTDTFTSTGISGNTINNSQASSIISAVTLAIQKNTGAVGSQLEVWVANTGRPEVWSTSNLPSTALAATNGAFKLTTYTITDGGAQVDVSFSLDPGALAAVHRLAGTSGFNGNLALILRNASGTASTSWITAEAATTVPTLTTTEGPTFTGLAGLHAPGPDRAARCPRCGTPTGKEKFIVDGVTRGYVCPQCYDPPPPAGMRRVPRFPN